MYWKDETQFVAFTLGAELFAIPIGNVKEIINATKITSVPKAECHVQGIINFRGKTITVLNLSSKLGLNSTNQRTSERKIIIVENIKTVVGFEVDTVSEVLKIPTKKIEPPPLMVQQGNFMTGIGKINERLILLLNVDTLVS